MDAATDLASASGWKGVRMEDIAARAAVGRRTVFREFGSKSGVLEAIAWRSSRELIDGSRVRLDEHRLDPVAAIAAVAEYMLVTTADHPLLQVLLTGQPGESDEFLSLMTTASGPFVDAATEFAVDYALEHWHGLVHPGFDVRFAVDSLVRILFSHIVQPGGAPDQLARSLGAMFGAMATAAARQDGGIE